MRNSYNLPLNVGIKRLIKLHSFEFSEYYITFVVKWIYFEKGFF